MKFKNYYKNFKAQYFRYHPGYFNFSSSFNKYIPWNLEKKLFPESQDNSSINLPDSKKEITLKQIRESYQLGLEYYRQNRLDKAEQEIINVLHPTLSKASMKNLYVNTEEIKEELLGSMYFLGTIYLRNNNYFNNYAKASGIFQYCAGFSERHGVNIKIRENLADSSIILNTASNVDCDRTISNVEYFLEQAYLVEKVFLNSINYDINNEITKEEEYYAKYHQEFTKYKKELESLRTNIRKHLDNIKDITVDEIEKRASLVEDIYQECNSFFVNAEGQGLVQRLLVECYKQLGGIPIGCEYAVIGLGSLAIGTMTPWSDLEFAILVNDDKYKEYFRNLTKLLHIKIINLGETHLKGMGIESLNNFKTGEEADEWFWDDIIKIKFNFDSARWNACKVPLGRQGSHKVKQKIKNDNGIEETIIIVKPDYELILTPEQMASFQKEVKQDLLETTAKKREEVEDKAETEENTSAVNQHSINWFESDKHLVQALRSVSLIDGSQKLLDKYRIKVYEVEDPEVLRSRVLKILLEDVNKFSLKLGDKQEGKLIDTKQHIYRLGDRVITGLANYYNIIAKQGQPNLTVWQMITEMAKGTEETRILSPKGAQHLKEAVAIATELRLRTYSNNNTREEMLSTFIPAVEHLSEEQKHHLLKETFHFQDTNILHHFYYVMLSIQNPVKELCNQADSTQAQTILKFDQLFDTSNRTKGFVHARFLEYEKAITAFKRAEINNSKDINIIFYLFNLYNKLGNIEQQYIELGKILKVFVKKQTSQNAADVKNLMAIAINLAGCIDDYGSLQDTQQLLNDVINFTNITIQNQDEVNYEMATLYGNLGLLNNKFGKFKEAIENYKKAISLLSDNPILNAELKKGLATVYLDKGELDNALAQYMEAYHIYLKEYALYPNHLNFAKIHSCFGSLYLKKSEYSEAIKQYEVAIKIYNTSYRTDLHMDILHIYCDLSTAYLVSNDYPNSDKYINKAKEITNILYLKFSYHPHLAEFYNILGNTYIFSSKIQLAIECFNQVKTIKVKIFGEKSNKIVETYISLAESYMLIQDLSTSADWLSKAEHIMQNKKEEFSPLLIINFHNIKGSLECNIGKQYLLQDKTSKAEQYFNNAIIHYKQVLEKSAHWNNLSIANLYNCLGESYFYINNNGEAEKHYNEAQKLYSQFNNKRGLACVVMNLGHLKGSLEEILNYYNQALTLYKEIYSDRDHLDIANLQQNIGMQCFKYNQHGKAKTHFLKALEIYQNLNIDANSSVIQNLIQGVDAANEKLIPVSKTLTLDAAEQKIENKIKEAFNQTKVKKSWQNAEIKIDISEINKKTLETYCESRLKLHPHKDLEFNVNNTCIIFLDEDAIKIIGEDILD